MKLVPLVEVRSTKPRFLAKHARPLDTPADKIAAAAHQGQVCVQPMVMFKYTDADDHRGCALCNRDTKEHFEDWHEHWTEHLKAFGVSWDPDIRL